MTGLLPTPEHCLLGSMCQTLSWTVGQSGGVQSVLVAVSLRSRQFQGSIPRIKSSSSQGLMNWCEILSPLLPKKLATDIDYVTHIFSVCQNHRKVSLTVHGFDVCQGISHTFPTLFLRLSSCALLRTCWRHRKTSCVGSPSSWGTVDRGSGLINGAGAKPIFSIEKDVENPWKSMNMYSVRPPNIMFVGL